MGGRLRRSPEDRFLAEYIDAYLSQAAVMSYADVVERQPPPHASVAHGAAGIAYAFLRAGRLVEAERWSTAAWDARDACRGHDLDPRDASLVFGPAGIAYVDARVAHATGAHARRDERIRAFAAWCDAPDDDPEIMQGRAGRLEALAALVAIDPSLAAIGDRIAGSLALDAEPWSSFAHGDAGPLHAVLRWSLARGTPLPAGWNDDVDRVIATATFGDTNLDRGWCRGSAGLAILLAAAIEHAPRPTYVDLIERAGEHAAQPGGVLDVCCGLAGRGFALLAIDRVLPGQGWRTRARDLAIEAIQHGATRHPNGLFRGHPGLVCLALDLLAPRPARFPLLED